MENQVWLCVVNQINFEVISLNKVYGVPNTPKTMKYFKYVKEGDILLFYLISPYKTIVGEAKVISAVFKESKVAPWADRQYPNRVLITEVEPLEIKWNDFFGKIASIKTRISMGASVLPISQEDYKIIKNLSVK